MNINIENSLRHGKSLVKLGNLAEAEKLYEKVLEKYPLNNRVKTELYKIKNKANPEIQKQFNIIFEQLINLYKTGYQKIIIEKSPELLKNFPDEPKLFNILGVTYSSLKLYDEALKHYKECHKLDPNNVEVLNNIGILYRDTNQIENSLKYFNKSILLNNKVASTYNNMGTLHAIAKNLDAAEKNFKQSIKLDNNFLDAYLNLGSLYFDNFDFDPALYYFKKIIKKDASYAFMDIVYQKMGLIFKEKGDTEKAIDYLNKALLVKESPALYNNLGHLYFTLKSWHEAKINFLKAFNMNSKKALYAYNIACCDYELNNKKEAILFLEKAINLNPNYEQANHLLSALNGNNVEKAPSNYVEELFDNYAENFENHLVQKLKYSTKRVKDIILKYSNKKSFKSVLDLGCGTGLVGLEIKNFSKKLTGVDISKKMIDKARSKKIYDTLICKELVSYLKENRLNHELIIASDVLTYFGECDEIFDLIKNNNNCKNTFFAFTTEHTEEPNYFLDTSGRFKHSYEYIENLCSVRNFELKYFEKNILRENKNVPVEGGLYLIKC